MATKEVKVPDIGDFADVPVITVFVKPGDTVAPDDPLIELESDKATMEVPSPMGGTVKELKIKEGDKVTEGSVILVLETEAADAPEKPAGGPVEDKPSLEGQRREPAAAIGPVEKGDIHAELVVLGSGPWWLHRGVPGGRPRAEGRAGRALPTLGGVCLNVGCIPSKALLHAAKVLAEAEDMAAHGIKLGKPEIDIDGLRGWKESVVKKLTGGLQGLSKAAQGPGRHRQGHLHRRRTR
jgi:dihydrolipoamide dehydrogenase